MHSQIICCYASQLSKHLYCYIYWVCCSYATPIMPHPHLLCHKDYLVVLRMSLCWRYCVTIPSIHIVLQDGKIQRKRTMHFSLPDLFSFPLSPSLPPSLFPSHPTAVLCAGTHRYLSQGETVLASLVMLEKCVCVIMCMFTVVMTIVTFCDLLQDLWICLICGHVGCGRYHGGHAHELVHHGIYDTHVVLYLCLLL